MSRLSALIFLLLVTSSVLTQDSIFYVTDVLPADGADAVTVTSTITVVFNRPVVPLTLLEEADDLPNPLQFTPSIPDGFGQWINSSTYEFQPTPAMIGGTQYIITVSNLTSTDGIVLDPFQSLFITESPTVVRVDPEPSTTNVAIDDAITLTFNQPMAQASVRAAFTLKPETPSADTVAGLFSWSENNTVLQFQPQPRLQLDTTYHVTLDITKAKTQVGAMSLVQEVDWTFVTIPYPSVLTTHPLDGSVGILVYTDTYIRFASPMDEQSLNDHIRVNPEADTVYPYFNSYDNTYYLNFEMRPATTYTVTIMAGAMDIYGNSLDRDISYAYTTADLDPMVFIQNSRTFGIFNAASNAKRLSIAHLNVDQIHVDLYNVTLDILIDALITEDPQLLRRTSARVNQWRIDTSTTETNVRARYSLELEGHTSDNSTCDWVRPPRMKIGDVGKIIADPEPLRLRDSAVDGEILTLMYRDTRFNVIDGPLCYDQVAWFHILTDSGHEGWVAEGDADEYYVEVLIPIDPTATVNATTSAKPLDIGVYYLEVASPQTLDQYQQSQVILVATTNIVMKYASDHAFVWVTDIQTGNSLGDVPVQFYDTTYTEYDLVFTDARGIATLHFDRKDNLYEPLIAVVHTDDHFGITSSNWTDNVEPYHFDIHSDYSPRQHVFYMYTDRPIYRPGQPVYFRGIVREKLDVTYTLPDFNRVQVTLRDNQGDIIYDQALPLDDSGAFADEFTLSDAAGLGNYGIGVRRADFDQDYPQESVFFTVAEYRRPNFQVTMSVEEDELVVGDTLIAHVKSQNFVNTAVSNAPLNYIASYSLYRFHYTGDGHYSFTDHPYPYYPRFLGYDEGGKLVIRADTQTDAVGEATLAIDMVFDEDTQESQRVTVEATVLDVDGLAVSNRTQAVVHKGLFYVGVKTDRYVATVDHSITIDVITVDWNSDPVANEALSITVERLEGNRFEEDRHATLVFSDSATTDQNGMAQVIFTPDKGGEYHIRATGRDSRDHSISASRTIWVSGSDYVVWGAREDNDSVIDLVVDRDSYKVGDTAKLLIPSPFQGETQALVTVERGSIFQTELLTLTSNSYIYELPITAQFAPNVFVSVVLIKGIDDTNSITTLRYGLVELTVDNASNMIQLAIQADPPNSEPRSEVTYTLQTRRLDTGDPVSAQVGVSLTDLASLSVADDNSQAIVDYFYGVQPLGVRTSSPLTANIEAIETALAQSTEESAFAFARGGVGGADESSIIVVRRDFVDTAYWNPKIQTDANGQAQVTLTLPDNLTTWRLDARAITAESQSETERFRVGHDQLDLIVSKPLIIRPTTPRFFVVSDETTLSAVIFNHTQSDQEVTTFIESTGLDILSSHMQTLTIAANDQAKVTWAVIVEDVEAVDLTFFATTQDYTDASRSSVGVGDDLLLPVYRYRARETVGTAGILNDADMIVEQIDIPLDTVTDSTVDIRTQVSLAAAALDGLDALRHVPYQSTEQAVSLFLPNIAVYLALEKLDLDDDELRRTLERELTIGLQILYTRQNNDGGWGWFPDNDSSPLTTAYALIGLHEARQLDYLSVSSQVIKRAQSYLLNVAMPQSPNPHWRYNREAFILYALAYSDAADSNRMSRLFDERHRLDNSAKTFLALAFHAVQDTDSRIDTLTTDLFTAAKVSATGTFWSSEDVYNWSTDTRTTALMLKLLVRHQPDSHLIPNVVRYLMTARAADAWETTQETAWAILALTDWMIVRGELKPNYAFTVTVNDQPVLSETVTQADIRARYDATTAINLASNELTVERSAGSGSFYYTAHLNAYLDVERINALSKGISVGRRYVIAEDNQRLRRVNSATVGEVVQVRLSVIAPEDLHYVVITDPLPAGVEAIDPQLETSAQFGTDPNLEVETIDRGGYGWFWFSNIDYRDEQVVISSTFLPAGTYEYVYSIRAAIPGKYHVIPPIAEEYYFPEVYGRGKGSIFIIDSE